MIKEFLRPQTVEEAVALKDAKGSSAVYLAGGTNLNIGPGPVSYERVISLEGLGLKMIRQDDAGVMISAGCTIQEILDAEQTPKLLRAAARQIINRSIREMATLGGNIASNQACGTMLVALAALDAEVELARDGATATVPVTAYIEENPGDLIVAARIPQAQLRVSSGSADFKTVANERSIIAAAATLVGDGDLVREIRLAMGGIGKRVCRLPEVEEKLAGAALPPQEELERLVSAAVAPGKGVYCSAAYKKHIAGVVAARAIAEASCGEGVAK